MVDKIVTVITVSYNASAEIQKTLDSIGNQSEVSNIDFIVMDGGSTDDTMRIVANFFENNRTSFFNFRYYSEKDNGVYDAMNKSVIMAEGEYIIFMNAGDMFADNKVVEDFINSQLFGKSDVVYGDTICMKNGNETFLKAGTVSKLKYKKPFCHQSAFTRTSVHNTYLFDCNYKIQADYDMFLRAYLNKISFSKWDRTISKFNMDGMSSNPHNYSVVFNELISLHKKNRINCLNTPIIGLYYLKCWIHKMRIKNNI